MLVQEFLSRSAARLPKKTALVCGDRRWSYEELEQASNRLAHGLIQKGVRRGDRVVVFLNNTSEAVVAIFAILKAGAVFVPVNHTTKQEKLQYILGNCRATAIVLEAHSRDISLERVLAEVPTIKIAVLCGRQAASIASGLAGCFDWEGLLAAQSAEAPRTVSEAEDLACLIYTSGSTGDPKGVMSGHDNVDFATSSIITYLENVEDDIVLNVSPLSFDYGLYQLLMVMKFGGTLVLERSFAYPAAILQRIEKERVTGFPGVPTVFAMLLDMDLSAFDLSSLRYLTNTAAALPPSHILELRRKFAWARLYSMYGLTETKRTLYLPPEQLDQRPGSVGIAIPGTEVWIEDEEGRHLGPGETGELVVRGPHVMRGYWEAPEATAQRYRITPDGHRVCYSGDLFRMDEEGYFYFVGRKDDIIKSRGEKVAPKEVENILHMLPGVTAAVVGVPDPIMGQAVKAFLVSKNPELTEAQVLAHCKAHLEDFMVPRSVEFRSEFPMTSTGKIYKPGLIREP